MNPKVSVILPVYNCQRHVGEAIASILRQDMRDFELLVLDDGSTDKSLSEIVNAADGRTRVKSRENRGLQRTLNELLDMASGEYVARMDADDIALPGRLRTQVDFLDQNPGHVVVGSRSVVIDSDGNPLTVWIDRFEHDEIDAAHIAGEGQSQICHPSVMMRRKAVLDVGGYDETAKFEDLALWLRLAEVGRLANLKEPLLKYRVHQSQITHTMQEQADMARKIVNDARARRDMPPLPKVPSEMTFVEATESEIRRKWAWWAFQSGNFLTAKKNAWAALRKEPLNTENLRLMLALFGTPNKNAIQS